jgi:hypothetical protein
MMLNFPYNAAIRSSTADFVLLSSGDIFVGQELAHRIISHGLRRRCLYRAERVNIDRGIDFSTATAEQLEDPRAVTSINSCTEPPYDQPPYTHAAGDFLMADRWTMTGLRGYDEAITFARLHLDSRFCYNAMAAGLDCELIGRIYHIDHAQSYTNSKGKKYPGRDYAYAEGLPYLNPRDWGLAGYDWEPLGPRLFRVGVPDPGAASQCRPMPGTLSPEDIDAANAVTRALLADRERRQPAQPRPRPPVHSQIVPLQQLSVAPNWAGADVAQLRDSAVVTTCRQQWAFSAALDVAVGALSDQEWCWLELSAKGVSGTVGCGLLEGEAIIGEIGIKPSAAAQLHWIPLDRGGEVRLMLRNWAADGLPSVIELLSLRLVRQARRRDDGHELLL